ncbi:MAG: iron ABC transporter permease [Armatimonadota bacterium]|nr:iron ABC transporter permease [Armatimonadota bacterium]MDR7464675.1 iron ABC transporter permease [Armatimonadota bacterium]MDR7538453.1 iron ABC transporter permease [Armatimonadota bacterium]
MAVALPSALTLRREGPVRGPVRRRPPGPLVLLPSLLVAGALLLPVLYLGVRAAGADEGIWRLLVQPRTLRILLRTVLLASAVTASAVAVALPLAWVTTRTDLPGARLWSTLTVLPLAVPSFISGIIVATVFGPWGVVHHLADRLGIALRPGGLYGFPGAWITLTLVTYPYVLLSARAGLRGMDPALEEAARTLGDGGWRAFCRVTVPHLRPWVGAGAVLVALYVLSDFGAVSMMQFESFTTAIYLQYQASFNRHYAAVLSLVLVAMASLIVLLEDRQGRGRFYRLRGTSRALPPRRLGPWRWPALTLCGLATVLGVLVPVGVIGYWLVVGVRQGEPLALALRPAFRSLYASVLAAGVTVVAALPVAILSVRHGGWLAGLISRLTYAGFALPGIVLALSLVFFAARYLPFVYQTLGLLIFAYAVHFLPQALGPLRAGLAQVSPSQEEAAQTLGRSPFQVLRTVTLPLVRPGVVAAAALVFLTTMKELPATLLLGPTGFETLATRIWSTATEGFFARAAAPALMLLGFSSLSLWLLLAQERWRGEG